MNIFALFENIGFGNPVFFASHFGSMCPALNRAYYYTTQFSPANGVTVRKGLAQAIDKVKTASPYILSAFYTAHASDITKYNATQPKVIASLSKLLQQL